MDPDLTEYNNGQYVRPKNEQIALYQPTLHDEISHKNKRHNNILCQIAKLTWKGSQII